MVAGSAAPQASNSCNSCLRAASSLKARSLRMMVEQLVERALTVAFRIQGKRKIEAALRVFGIGRKLGAERVDVARVGRLARKLEARPGAGYRRAVSLGRRHERQGLLGAGEISGLDVALGKPGGGAGILRVLLQRLAESLRGAIDVARGKCCFRILHVGGDIGRLIADQPRDKRLYAALGQRPHEAVDRPSVLEGEHGRNRLNAHLAWDLRVVVDVELDELDRALGRAHRLLQYRRQLPAGTAPRRPEIDQNRDLARGLDHVAHEILGGGVLDEVGVGRCRAFGKDRGIHAATHSPSRFATLYVAGGKAKPAARPILPGRWAANGGLATPPAAVRRGGE